jgi:AraC-like DNA-binding protein
LVARIGAKQPPALVREGMMTVNKDDGTPVRFSSDDIEPKNRLPILREVLGRVYLHMDMAPLGEAPFRLEFEQHSLPRIMLYFATLNPIDISRTRDLIGDGNGDYSLILPADDARRQFLSGSDTEDLNGGDAALLFNGTVGTIRYLTTCRSNFIAIPRAVLEAAVGQPLEDRPIRRILPTSGPALRLLSSYVTLLRHTTSTADPTVAYHAAQHLVDLIALAIGASEEAQERAALGAVPSARLAAIRADVLANLSWVLLSPKTIACRHGLSERYVHVLFEQAGQTFSKFVEQERLKRAFALLRDPARTHMRISEIASLVGFAEHSTFDRAFRRRFGETPRGVRNTKNQRQD